jgi:ElaB/YqjD/DUF883 family membrane-anchored ribosome-binding protein
MNTDTSLHTHTPASSRQKLVDDIATVASEAGELLKEFSDAKLQRTRQAMTQAQSAISASAGEMGNTAGTYVRAYPWRAVGVAGVVGLVAGLLLARR